MTAILERVHTGSTTPDGEAPPIRSPSNLAAETLAIYGGPRAVPGPLRERWRHVRLSDLTSLVPFVLAGINTRSRGGLISKFEARFASLTNTRYALLLNSGTATLHSAYMALGIRPGDEVIVPTYTWFASATPILQCGGTPIFADIDPKTLTLDPADAEQRITPRTKAICVVHVWGNPAAMDRFVDLSKRYNVAIIEDCSHAHGATYQQRPVGCWGDIGCFSLQGSKAVSGGEAGVVVTDNPTLFDRILSLGLNGRAEDRVTDEIDIDQMNLGLKYRPHLAAAAMAGASLSRLGKLNGLRRRNYDLLAMELADCPALFAIDTYPEAVRGGLLEFILRYEPEHANGWPREAFVNACRKEGVPIAVDRYTQVGRDADLLHQSALFNDLDRTIYGGAMSLVNFESPPRDAVLPNACRLASRLVSLPPLTKVSARYVRQLGQALCKVVNAARTIRDFRSGT